MLCKYFIWFIIYSFIGWIYESAFCTIRARKWKNRGLLYAKVFVSDDKKAVVGTINLDYRSFYHHFECGTFLYRTDCIADIERDFQNTLEKCRHVTPTSIRNEKKSYKLIGSLLKFIAPLL